MIYTGRAMSGFLATAEAGIIMTVAGPIDVSELGKTLAHLHVLVDFIGAEETGDHRCDRSEVIRKVIPYLRESKKMG